MQTVTIDRMDFYLKPLWASFDGKLSLEKHEGWYRAGFVLNPVNTVAPEEMEAK